MKKSAIRKITISTLNIGFLISLFSFIGCSSNKSDSIEGKSPEKLYAEATQLLKNKEYSEAAETFNQIESLFPYSSKAAVSQILAAYSHFLVANYMDATRELEIFMRYHSGHKLMPYALYLKAMCIYMQVASVGRDARIAHDAKEAFNELINRFPDSPYSADSMRKIFVLDSILAAHEMNIGRYYQNKSNTLSALGRYDIVINKYGHTNQAPEAYYRIIECCLADGLVPEALSAYEFLKNNFVKNDWKIKADALMARKGAEKSN